MSSKSYQKPLYDSDVLMRNLWLNLAQDLKSNLGTRDFCPHEDYIKSNRIAAYRTLVSDVSYWVPKYLFKARYQLDSLFKRYRFKEDLYTQQELHEITCTKFLATQLRIATKKPIPYRSELVLRRARLIVKGVLGKFDAEKHLTLCKFGKRAAVGVTAKLSYLDNKLSGPITGSRDHIRWFKSYLQGDKILLDTINSGQNQEQGCEPIFCECDELRLTNVPKSFKSLRSIMPNTIVGSFYTYGLGKYIQECLKSINLNVSHLQQRHRDLVHVYSKDLSHVTADLSSASDSFTWELLCKMLPRDWLNALNFGRITKVKIDDDTYRLESFMTMGIGFTFQLQTLLFYSLIQAVKQLTGCKKGRVSVYGDDLIYPKELHGYIKAVFTDIGFILNTDKTFVHESFRESCGSDSYCGIDVRPFQPEGQHQMLSGRQYEMLVFKTINGLMLRWAKEEIGITYKWLLSELLRVTDVICQVPPSYPDYSGIRTSSPSKDFLLPWFEVHHGHHGTWCFAYLHLRPRDRAVLSQGAFYWESMRAANTNDDDTFYWDKASDSCILRWITLLPKPKNYRSNLTGQRLRKLQAVVSDKERQPVVLRQETSIHSWI